MSWPQLYLGVALTTLATLILELSLTRIFSVVFYYHFAFLAISIALFGLGAGGVFSYFVAARPGPSSKLGTLAVVNGLAVVVALTFLITRPGDMGYVTLGLVSTSQRRAVFPFGHGAVAGGRRGGGARRPRLLLRSARRGGGMPGAGSVSESFRRTEYRDWLPALLFAVSAAIWYNSPAGRPRRRRWRSPWRSRLSSASIRIHPIDIRYAKGRPTSTGDVRQVEQLLAHRRWCGRRGGCGIVIDADAATGIAPLRSRCA